MAFSWLHVWRRFASCRYQRQQTTANIQETSDTESREIAENYIKNMYWSHIKIYTDGSKDTENKKKNGMRICHTALNVTRKIKLHPNLTVYTSELIAIQKALQWILDNNLNFKVAILTDLHHKKRLETQH